MKQLIRIYIAVACLVGAPALSAATIGLTPASATVAPGGQVSFDLVADFGDISVLGGATDITWDPDVISFSGFTFDDDVAARDLGLVLPQSSSQLTIVLGSATGLDMGPGTTIGSLTFTAVGSPGSSSEILLADNDLSGFLRGALFPDDWRDLDGLLTAKLTPMQDKFDDKFNGGGLFDGGSKHGSLFDGARFDKNGGSSKFDFDKHGDSKFDFDFKSIDVDYSGATVQVVPLPAAGWLLLSALGGLALLRRRAG